VRYLYGGCGVHVLIGLVDRVPWLATEYGNLFRVSDAPEAYAKEVRGIVKLLQKKYRVTKSERV